MENEHNLLYEEDSKSEDDSQQIYKQKKYFLFSFSRLNKHYLLPFISPFLCVILDICLDILMDHKKNNEKFSLDILFSFSIILSGLLFFVPNLRKKFHKNTNIQNNKEMNNRNNSTIELIYNEKKLESKDNLNNIYYMILLIIFFSVSNILNNEVHYPGKHIFEQRMYSLIIIPILSKFILKEKIYNHQKIFLYISLIGILLTFMPIILLFNKNDIPTNIYVFIEEICYALFLILLKYLIVYLYASPFICLFYIGIGYFTISIIYYMIYSLIKFHNFSLITNIFIYSNFEIEKLLYLYIFLIIIFSAFYHTSVFLVINYFSPTLLLITEFIKPILFLTYKYIAYKVVKKEEEKLKEEERGIRNMIFYYSGYIIVLICALFYNEIIICNYCNLNENTRKFIEQRQIEELSSLSPSLDETQINKNIFDDIQ